MSSSIMTEKIATCYHAPQGAEAINLYAFNGVEHLTLPQLVMAVCIRQASMVEQFSVYKMNDINASANWLSAVSLAAQKVTEANNLSKVVDFSKTGYQLKRVGGDGKKCTLQDFIVKECGISQSLLPSKIQSVDDKSKVFTQLQNVMNRAALNNQEQAIALQSLLSRRDSTYNMSASVIKKLGTTMQITAGNF